jgi:hypothetical protein
MVVTKGAINKAREQHYEGIVTDGAKILKYREQ